MHSIILAHVELNKVVTLEMANIVNYAYKRLKYLTIS